MTLMKQQALVTIHFVLKKESRMNFLKSHLTEKPLFRLLGLTVKISQLHNQYIESIQKKTTENVYTTKNTLYRSDSIYLFLIIEDIGFNFLKQNP